MADFGLSEDVYEKSYFRQGKSAVKLPIKWMALESSTDGIFSEKTDVVGVSVCSSLHVWLIEYCLHSSPKT